MLKKTILPLTCAFGCILALAACGGGQTTSSANSSSSSQSSSSQKQVSSTTSSLPTSSVASSSSLSRDPTFSQALYSYDKNVGLDLEMPLELKGANIYYVYFSDEALLSTNYSYDSAKAALVINEAYMLELEKKTYAVKVVTDGDGVNPAITSVEVTNSIVTSFDDNASREYAFGKDKSLVFNANFSTATVAKIVHGDVTVPSSAYSLQNNLLTIDHTAFDGFYGDADYSVYLSNHDKYDFHVKSNVIFFSDYDHSTIHNDTESYTGQNPLYQYIDKESVSISDGSAQGFEGNVLKIIPTTTENDMGIHGYITLKNPSWSSTWYDVGYQTGGLYSIAFDYTTLDVVDNGNIVFDFETTSGHKQKLLFGEGNNGIIHHFSTILKGSDIGNGTLIWAFFKGSAGSVLIDNFRVTSLADQPVVGSNLAYGMNGDFSFDLTDNGYYFDLYSGTAKIPYSYENGKITIAKDTMAQFGVGNHSLTLRTAIGDIEIPFQVTDSRVASLSDKSVVYVEGQTGAVSLKGSFESSITVASLKQKFVSKNGGYEGWEFNHSNPDFDYSSLVTLVPGLNESGHLDLSEDFLKKAIGNATFTISYSNGKTEDFTVNSNRIEQSNYDDLTLFGELNGGGLRMESPLSSGMGASTFEIKERASGNKALYVNSTNGTAASCLYTMRLHTHPWEWYTVAVDSSKLSRVRFSYAAKDVDAASFYFTILTGSSQANAANFFGSGYTITSAGDHDEIRFPLIADGTVHEFDSGWFTYDSSLRLMGLMLPVFTAADGRYVMTDDFVFSQSSNPTANLANYTKNVDTSYAIPCAYTVSKVTIDGSEVAFTKTASGITIAQEIASKWSIGSHSIAFSTNEGDFNGSFSVVSDEKATLSETSKTYTVGDTSVLFKGEFSSTVTVTSARRYGSNASDPNAGDGLEIAASDITLSSTGLSLNANVLNYLYGTTKIMISVSSGAQFELTLANNRPFYCDFAHTTIWSSGSGNIPSVQDSSMVSFATDATHGTYLVYQPKNATLGYSSPVGSTDCGIFTTKKDSFTSFNWTSVALEEDATYKIIMSYSITGASEGAQFIFRYGNSSVSDGRVTIDAAQTSFSYETKGSDINWFDFICLNTTEEARAAFTANIYSLQIVKE